MLNSFRTGYSFVAHFKTHQKTFRPQSEYRSFKPFPRLRRPAGWCRSNARSMNSGDARFETRPDYQLSWQVFTLFSSDIPQVFRHSVFKMTKAGSYQIIYSPFMIVFVSHPTLNI